MNTFNTKSIYTNDDYKQLKLQTLLKRIKELQEIVDASNLPVPSTSSIPAGYTPARWNLALQSFTERLPNFKSRNFLRNDSAITEGCQDLDFSDFEIEFGPEWDLKCAQRELEELLNK